MTARLCAKFPQDSRSSLLDMSEVKPRKRSLLDSFFLGGGVSFYSSVNEDLISYLAAVQRGSHSLSCLRFVMDAVVHTRAPF